MSTYFDMGTHSRPVTTASAEAQAWFDRGLMWVYGFNHEEAVVCFRKAAEADPGCAMAWWGIAYASGPFLNMPWDCFSPAEAIEALGVCYNTVQQAVALAPACSLAEQSLIGALSRRFPQRNPPAQVIFAAWEGAYIAAMRDVYHAHPGDLDIAALFAEAMMMHTPWKLWDVHTGRHMPGAHTAEIVTILEETIGIPEERVLPPHPGVLHMYVHAIEMSPKPEKAEAVADLLAEVAPRDAGHLHHMPAHIYLLCGRYRDAVEASHKAIEADNKYLAYAGPHNFYTTSRCHDLHLMMYAGMFLGRYQPAIEAANAMTRTLTPDVLNGEKPHMVMTMEGYYSMKMHVLVRFGKWREILEEAFPEDHALYCVTTAMHHYARGVAHAALGGIAEAGEEQKLFNAARAAVPLGRRFFNNSADDILAIGAAMLAGELVYRAGRYDEAFGHLREAARRNDNLFYTEPWAWMHPPHHALGALLLEQDRVEEAEAVYRADLGLDDTLNRCSRHPGNVWSLHGLVECLKRRGAAAEITMLQPQLDFAIEQADTVIAASCCCRGMPQVA